MQISLDGDADPDLRPRIDDYQTPLFLVGLTTHTGTVTAASDWDEPAQRRRVRPSLAGSYERLFRAAGVGAGRIA